MRYFLLTIVMMLAMTVVAQKKWIPLIEELETMEAGSKKAGALAVDICWEISESSPDSAIYYGQMGLEIGRKLKNDSIVARALLGLSVADSYKGKHAEAIEKSFEALKLAEGIQDTITMADAVNNIGIDMYYQGDLDAAFQYYKLYAQYAEVTGNMNRYANALNNIAMIEEERGNTEKELAYYQEALEIFDRINERVGYVNTKINLGTCYFQLGRYDEALKTYEESYHTLVKMEYTSALGELLTFWSQVLMAQGKYKPALSKIREGIRVSVDTNNTLQEMLAYELLHQIFFKMGRLDSAYFYQAKYQELLNASREEQKVELIEELRAGYEMEKKEQQIEQLEQEREIQALQADRDRQTRYLLITAALALVVIVGLLYFRYRSKSKTNQLLDEKNKELADLNRTKDRLFSIISHDLKSPLSSFHTITTSLTSNWDQLEKNQLKSFIESLQESSADIRDMMDNLLKWALSQTDQLHYKPVQVSPKGIIDRVVSQLTDAAMTKQIEIYTGIKDDSKIIADQQFLEIVIRNLLSNALKFSAIQSRVEVLLEDKSNALQISIRDYGVGMEQAQAEALLSGKIVGHDIQNSHEKGTGLGLVLCKELMTKMNAILEVQSESQKGTTFHLIFEKAA